MSTVTGGQGNIIKDGLVLWLDAANPRSYPPPYNGTTWTDLSGNNNSGSLINGPLYSLTNRGNITLDGVDDYIQVNDNPLLNFGTGNFTVLLWVSGIPSFPGATKAIIWKGSRFDNNTAGWSITWAGSPQSLYFIISSNSSRIEGLANFGPGWSGYKMIGIQRSNGSWRSINNTSITNLGTFNGDVSNSNPLYIGRNGHYNQYLNCNIGSSLIYNRALSSTEILQNYNATRARFGI